MSKPTFSPATLERDIYANTAWTSAQARQFAESFASDQLWEICALLEAMYEAGFEDGAKEQR